MPEYRSHKSTRGRNMAGARALWRATGMTDEDFKQNKPIIAVVNSFTQFVPGHVHLKDIGQLVCREIENTAESPKNSILSPLTTELLWDTTECCIPCQAVI